jgi:hypothetical protein
LLKTHKAAKGAVLEFTIEHAGAKQRHIEQGLFHGGVAQREPLLQEVDAQHGLQLERRAAEANDLIHGFKKAPPPATSC